MFNRGSTSARALTGRPGGIRFSRWQAGCRTGSFSLAGWKYIHGNLLVEFTGTKILVWYADGSQEGHGLRGLAVVSCQGDSQLTASAPWQGDVADCHNGGCSYSYDDADSTRRAVPYGLIRAVKGRIITITWRAYTRCIIAADWTTI